MIFEEIYETYWQKVFRLCMGYVNDYELAQDITQEIFVVVWQELPKFRKEASISTWVFRIAVNTCIRQIEKRSRFRKAQLSENLKEEKEESIEPEIQFLYQCIAELPETERIIISLELENVKQADIAVITGMSEVNVRTKVYRIKKKLSEKFKEYGR